MRAQHHHQEPLTYEKVWRIIQDQNKETQKMFQETDKKINKLEGFFSSQWGRFVETLVSGDLINMLKERNINCNRIIARIKAYYKEREYEFDVVAVNGDEVVVVEVKTTLNVEDVKEFSENLKVFKAIFKEYKENKVYGAVAYLQIDGDADKYAYRQGFLVIKATGKSSVITNDKKFVPKAF